MFKSVKSYNVLVLSLSFFFLFAAFFTMGNVQTVVIDSAKDPNSTSYVEGFDGDGYISLGVMYAVSFLFDLASPAIVSFLGLRTSLMISSCTFTLFIGSFFYLSDALLYTASAILGIGNGVIWVAQGSFLSRNSGPLNIDRNSGFFYLFWTGSGVAGNTYSYFQFKDESEIDDETRFIFVSVLFTLSCLGTATMILLRPAPKETLDEKSMFNDDSASKSTSDILRNSLKLLGTRQMLLLLPFFLYVGMMFTFWTGVYGPSLSFSESFGDQGASLAGLHGILVNAAGMTVGLINSVFGDRMRRMPRFIFVMIALICHLSSYAFMVMNVPNEAPKGDTSADALVLVPSSTVLAMVSSYLLGFGAGIVETQSIAFLGSEHAQDPSPAFAIMKMCHHLSMGVSYMYAGYLDLYWQIALLVCMGSLGCTTFTFVDIKSRRRTGEKQELK